MCKGHPYPTPSYIISPHLLCGAFGELLVLVLDPPPSFQYTLDLLLKAKAEHTKAEVVEKELQVVLGDLHKIPVLADQQKTSHM